MKTPTPTLLLLLFLAFVSVITSSSSSHGEWEVLTEQNFSSQIRLHPHVLLFVTTPWCGESRSLKNEITQLVQRREEFELLKLRVVYRNSEKVLAQAIAAAANGITILYYHNSVPYNYLGTLRASNILSSIHPYLTSTPQALPLKHLKSPESLKDFLESSDKTLLLFEFCGWTTTLLSELKKNVTEEDNLWQRNFSETVETDRLLKLRGKNNQKVAGYAEWNNMCGLKSGFGRVPWLEDFSYVNDTAALQENGRVNLDFGQTCNHEQFKKFSSFLSKLIATTKEFSLPPERQKFGLITEESLASSFNIGESDSSWAAVLQLAGCPHCSKILKAGDDIKRFLKMENLIVTELEDERQDHESFFPASKPSVILFVDRSSGSLEDRRRSIKALDTFREVAAQHKLSDIKNWENDINYENSVSQADQESGSVSVPKTVRKFKTIKLKKKVSFVILDGDKNVALDTIAPGMEGSSLQEILTNLIHRRKESKLSSIAKDVGFRLLSDDVRIKVLDALPSQVEVMSGPDTTSSSTEGSSESFLHPKEGDVQNRASLSSDEKDGMKSFESESSSPNDEEQVTTNRSEQLLMAETDKTKVYVTENVNGEIKVSLHSEPKEDLMHSFTGSFFFSDVNYALLRALAGDVKIPSAVIIDPALQQHFVLQDELAFSSSLVDFLHGFLNGSLSPYTQSESTIQMPRKATVPPFVNLDFHEVDSIPRVTVNTFSHSVHGWNQSSTEKAPCPLCQDVLVLFSNNWCGFCQRMELVLREVYRSLKEYNAIIQGGSRNNQRLFKSGETPINGKNLKSPLIYLMDCTLNDCSLILKSINQREIYPSLILFPAERNKVIPYKGETSVIDITDFLTRHANNSHEFFRILPTLSGKGRRDSNKFDQSSSAVNNKGTNGDKLVEVVLRDREPAEREVNHDQVNSQSPPAHSLKTAPQVKTGTILVATEKLAASQPFAKSKILIIKAGPEFGFLGLIFNKRLRWKSFPDLGETAELLKETPLLFGGPVVDPGIPLLALTRERDSSTNHDHLEISPGVYFLDHQSVARRIQELKSRELNPSEYWFFLGYSSWSYEQLFDEISLGVWEVDNNEIGFVWP